jgi:sulfoxide reductase heme-binding subunit YedZ
MLMVTLAVTPIHTVVKIRETNSVRRTFGLYTFFYASLHGLIFFWIDYGFNFEFILLEVVDKRFIIVGVISFLLLTPLAVTSTNNWQKRLGKKWKTLHKTIYLIGVLVIIHYVWQVKADIRWPMIYGVILAILLVARVRNVRRWLRGLL